MVCPVCTQQGHAVELEREAQAQWENVAVVDLACGICGTKLYIECHAGNKEVPLDSLFGSG